MIFAVKRKKENNEQLMRRFKKQIQSARLLQKTRIARYHSQPKRKIRVRAEAISRTHYRNKRKERILWS